MRFKIEKPTVDLDQTLIENIFLDQYLPIATGNAIKVYLHCFKKAVDGKAHFKLKDLSIQLNLTEQEIEESIQYWLNEGVIKRTINTETGENDFSFLSLRELFLGLAEPYQGEELSIVPKMDSRENQEMFKSIEEILGIELSANQMIDILDFMSETNQTPELIVMAFQYSSIETGKKNVNYVLGILRNWFTDGILTLDDFLKSEAEKEEKKARKREVHARRRSYFTPEEHSERNLDEESMEDLLLQQRLKRIENEDDGK